MNPVASKAQRHKTLRNIRHAESAMLPPGWDTGLESQFGATLTAPQAAPQPTPTVKPCPAPEAAQDADTSRSHIDHRARRFTWTLIALWCAGWIFGPVLWWLFA